MPVPVPPPLPPSFTDEDAAAPTRAARARPHASASSSSPGQAVPGAVLSGQETRPMPKSSFDEPTRIPAPLPPPLESGRWEPGDLAQFAPHAAAPSAAAGAAPGLQRGRTRMWYVAAALIAAALGVLLVMTWLTVGGAAGRGTLSIVSLPAGAEVRVDGTGVSTVTPLTLGDVDRRQPHHVRVSKVGYDVWESDVKFPADEVEVRVQAVLVPTVGSLQITSTPAGAEVIVNGRVRGMTPTTVGDLPPNEDVLIELRLRGYKAAARTVTFAGKRSLVVSIPLEKAK
jgi:hypothetical protein